MDKSQPIEDRRQYYIVVGHTSARPPTVYAVTKLQTKRVKASSRGALLNIVLARIDDGTLKEPAYWFPESVLGRSPLEAIAKWREAMGMVPVADEKDNDKILPTEEI